VLLQNQVGWPGIDWTGGVSIGDQGVCPRLEAGLEFKAGIGGAILMAINAHRR
jgi:hypothetical protein